MMSTAMVTNTHDSGVGSLRDAIQQVNSGTDNVIDFALSSNDPGYSSGSWTISAQSPLPGIAKAVLIDGLSQAGYAGAPVIQISGSSLAVDAANVTVRGLNVSGIQINGQGGANAGNDVIASDALAGVSLTNYATNDTVSGNSFAANSGIALDATSGYNTLESNQFGNDSDGPKILVASTNNLIKDNTITEDPRWSFCTGIQINGNDNTVQDNTFNYVGGTGLAISGSSNIIEGNHFNNNETAIDLTAGATNNLIGGYNNPTAANVIGGGDEGINVSVGAERNAIVGNSISYPGTLGIDLNGSGNEGQAAPIISSAASTLSSTTIKGSVHSFADSTVRIELFSSPAGSGASGQTLIGWVTLTTNSAGNASFTDQVAGTMGGDVMTATATVMRLAVSGTGRLQHRYFQGETSQFSAGRIDTGFTRFVPPTPVRLGTSPLPAVISEPL